MDLVNFNDVLTSEDVAEILGVSVKTAVKLQKEAIKSFVLNPNSQRKVLRTLKADMLNYMEQGGQQDA